MNIGRIWILWHGDDFPLRGWFWPLFTMFDLPPMWGWWIGPCQFIVLPKERK